MYVWTLPYFHALLIHIVRYLPNRGTEVSYITFCTADSAYIELTGLLLQVAGAKASELSKQKSCQWHLLVLHLTMTSCIHIILYNGAKPFLEA